MKLTRAERLLVGQIVNVKLDSATLKDHIMLEGIYKAVNPDSIDFPYPPQFVDKENEELFNQYEGQKIDSIENEEHKQIIQEAIRKSKEAQSEIWANQGGDEEEIDLSDEQKKTLLDFFEQDKRSWPREYHQAIIDLHGKLSG
jgi:hypothetical protein